ncbi:scopoletin glucosyltransferase-like [Wolffia australiana]
METGQQELRVFVFPLMAAGHLLPAVDIAKLLANQDARVSIIVTPGNAAEVQKTTHLFSPPIEILVIDWPYPVAERRDHMSQLTSENEHLDFLISTADLRPSFEQMVKLRRPAAMITDMFYPWTADVAEENGALRLVFHGINFFSLCLKDKLLHNSISEINGDRFVVPGIPHKIELERSQIFDPTKARPDFVELLERMKEAERRSFGTVVNSFYELEPEYADHYTEIIGRTAFHVGPVFLRGGERGGEDKITSWLDSKPAGSVLYVCFGSLSRFTNAQLREIAIGLESSGHPFVWVVREDYEVAEKEVKSGKGVIVRGWAPQLVILNHRAVGGFLTHCGWNSSLESIAAGVPVVTWPMFADQFFNERLLVDVLKIGLQVGVTKYTLREEERELVKAEEIAAAVGRLMGLGEEAEERRRRTRGLREAARRAVEEGGSSRKDLGRLVRAISSRQSAVFHM